MTEVKTLEKKTHLPRFTACQMRFNRVYEGLLISSVYPPLPVYYAPEGIDVVGAFVLIIQVVGMLPNVEAQQRGQSCAYGIASVCLFGDVQLAVLINRQPCPARTEQSDCCRVEFLLEILELPKSRLMLRQFPVGCLATVSVANCRKYNVCSALVRHC